jgi:hypothetical protein
VCGAVVRGTRSRLRGGSCAATLASTHGRSIFEAWYWARHRAGAIDVKTTQRDLPDQSRWLPPTLLRLVGPFFCPFAKAGGRLCGPRWPLFCSFAFRQLRGQKPLLRISGKRSRFSAAVKRSCINLILSNGNCINRLRSNRSSVVFECSKCRCIIQAHVA